MTNRTAKRRRLLEDLFGSKLDEEDKDKEEFNDFLEYADDRPQIQPNNAQTKKGIIKEDCTGKWGLSCFQKITSALCQLAYGCAMDATNNSASSSFKTSSPSSSSSPRSKTSSSSSSSSPSSKPSSPSSKPSSPSSKPSSPSSKPSSPSSKPSSPSSKPSSPFLFDSRTHPVSKYL
ncbi:hypothetical protein PCASD_12072 [Puccinia coronata f. sp. avenae]|uniref:Uncharacterized protein n=1 Tax=Puccinia coronata f. sp. avenae TaxID=200324 RepID=A0A2N5UEX1_9BASI|nr:hypothetical protein PCASD_12072 [Puccinia coronata f. sp. avenae]